MLERKPPRRSPSKNQGAERDQHHQEEQPGAIGDGIRLADRRRVA
jgi:hypothetical protein